MAGKKFTFPPPKGKGKVKPAADEADMPMKGMPMKGMPPMKGMKGKSGKS